MSDFTGGGLNSKNETKGIQVGPSEPPFLQGKIQTIFQSRQGNEMHNAPTVPSKGGRRVGSGDHLEMAHTQWVKAERRRMCEKNLPWGYSDFHHTQSYHLGDLRSRLPGRQGVVQKPVVTTYRWCSLTFLPRRMKWPVILPSCLTHTVWFFIQPCMELNHLWSEVRSCSEDHEKSKANSIHLHKRSWGDSCPFDLFPMSQSNTYVHI